MRVEAGEIHEGAAMASRLKTLPPRLTTLKPYRIQQPEGRQEYDKQRSELAWRKWYNSARWRKLRWSVLVRDLFTCRLCGRTEPNTSLLVADHRKPHRGDERLFWDEHNLQCLCAPCHNGAKQKEEQDQW